MSDKETEIYNAKCNHYFPRRIRPEMFPRNLGVFGYYDLFISEDFTKANA